MDKKNGSFLLLPVNPTSVPQCPEVGPGDPTGIRNVFESRDTTLSLRVEVRGRRGEVGGQW